MASKNAKIDLSKALRNKSVSAESSQIHIKKLPNKLAKNNYWLKLKKYNKYPKNWKKKKKRTLKRYWKLTTNLNKYTTKVKKKKF
ncbi:unnamed protein product, partial [marine sediment metagenome]